MSGSTRRRTARRAPTSTGLPWRLPYCLHGLIGAGLLMAVAAPLAAQSTHLLVVTGLGGSPAYTQRFEEWGARLVAAAEETGVPPENIVWLAEPAVAAAGVDGPSRTDRVVRELAALTERSADGDLLVVVLFGHGSGRDGESRVHLPGPDLTAGQLDALLDPLSTRHVVVVNAASASGGFVPALSAPGRVVITATRSSREAEATRFGGHFVDALAGEGADTDKDGRVTLLEAFEYTRREVERAFADAGHLPTEHALLDDDGDGVGALEPSGTGDGALAARLALAPTAAGEAAATATGAAAGDSSLASLRAEQARLRAALDSLRARQDSMTEEAYEAELEQLLLEIARTGQALREAGGGPR